MPTPSFSRLPSHPEQGLLAWLENTRVSLPLKAIDCRFEVTSGIASVELDQIFHQNNPRALDCSFAFPLPAGAAVHCCEVHINGRTIVAKVEERREALRQYQEQCAAGRRAALVESERENLFTLSLGNLQPEDLVIVRFGWFQVLDVLDRTLQLRLPLTPGTRYIPGKPLLRSPSGNGVANDTDQVPDASRITPPRIDALHPDAAFFALRGRIDAAGAELESVLSSSHNLIVRPGTHSHEITLGTGDSVPDRDCVIQWNEPLAQSLVSQARVLAASDGNRYALLSLRAPEIVDSMDRDGRDFYFLIDRSGSMQGVKWTRTCEALHAFVRQLGEHDRVWLTFFESSFQDFAERLLPAKALLSDRNFLQLEQLGTAGGTELLPALQHVVHQRAHLSAQRSSVAVLITDGQVGNEAAVLELARTTPKFPIFVFGIDTAVNDAFARDLARATRGSCWLQTPNDAIVSSVAKLGARLRRPVLTQLKIADGWEAASDDLPDVYASDRCVIPVRSISGQSGPLTVTGRDGRGADHTITFDPLSETSPALRLHWGRERIRALETQGDRERTIQTAKQFNLLCRDASFVAWDEAEKVAIATEQVVQPALEPMGGFAAYAAAPAAACDELMESKLLDSSFHGIQCRELEEPRRFRAESKSVAKPSGSGLLLRLRELIFPSKPDALSELHNTELCWKLIKLCQAEVRPDATQTAMEFLAMWKKLALLSAAGDRIALFEKFLRKEIADQPLREKLGALFLEGQKTWVSAAAVANP